MLTFLSGLLGALTGRAQGQRAAPALSEAQISEYYQKGTTLIEPYLILADNTPQSGARKATDLREGIRYLDSLTQLAPDNYAAYWFKGKAYQALRLHSEAYGQFERSYALNRNNADVARELMIECLDLGKGPKAVAVAQHALSLHADDAGLMANLALAYLINGNLKEAGKAIDQAIAHDAADAINRNIRKVIDEVASGKRPRPKRMGDLQ